MRTDKPLSHIELWLYHHYNIVHGLRIATAFLLSFLMIRGLHLPEGTWPLITLVVVMGPVSTWGNVFTRAGQRIWGTVIGASSGLIALRLELLSLPLMLAWCCIVIFICGILTVGKQPYMALLIGITLCIVVGAPPGAYSTALWRSGDVILGCLLAILFTGIFAQRAYIFWRIRLADALNTTKRIYHTGLSANLIEKPRLETQIQKLLTAVVKMRALLEPACKETRIPRSVFEGIQVIERNIVNIMQMQINAWWSSRDNHLLLINAPALKRNHLITENLLTALSEMLIKGDGATEKILMADAELHTITYELKALLDQSEFAKAEATPVYGYLWLSLELNHQLERMSELIRLALRH